MASGASGRFFTRRVWQNILNEVFPEEHAACRLCRRPLPSTNQTPMQSDEFAWATQLGAVCPFCIQEAVQVALANKCNEVALCHPNAFTEASPRQLPIVCAMTYSGFVRTSIRHFKYDGLADLVPWFAAAMLDVAKIRHLLGPGYLDGVVHVPTSADRAKKRGYDQGHILAAAIAAGAKLPHIVALLRHPDAGAFTQSQTAKSVQQRRRSLEGKFATIEPANIVGKRILLVDDVMTTGATLQTCADVLLTGGAKAVIGLVIAYVR